MLTRGKGWIPQIIASDRRVRARKDFPVLASLLAARGVDASAAILLDGNFVSTSGDKNEFLLVLPDGKWVWATLDGKQLANWFEDVRDDYGDDFQGEVEKYRMSRQSGKKS